MVFVRSTKPFVALGFLREAALQAPGAHLHREAAATPAAPER